MLSGSEASGLPNRAAWPTLDASLSLSMTRRLWYILMTREEAWTLTVRDEALLPFKSAFEIFDRFVNQAAFFQQLAVAGQLIG